MAESKLLTVREVSLMLGISEKEVLDLAQNGSLPAYKIGGVYLRFKQEQVEEFKKAGAPLKQEHVERGAAPLKDRVSDFFYFNDFYILSLLIIALILLVIVRGF